MLSFYQETRKQFKPLLISICLFPSQGQPYIRTKLNSNVVTSVSSAEDVKSDSDGFPPSAAIALAVCLTCVVIVAVVLVWRGRKSRPRAEARKLLYSPYRPSI